MIRSGFAPSWSKSGRPSPRAEATASPRCSGYWEFLSRAAAAGAPPVPACYNYKLRLTANLLPMTKVGFVSLGCPRLTIDEIARIARLLEGQQFKKEFWITTARQTSKIADRLGYTRTIEEAGARFAADTCCVVAPIRGRFTAMATDSAKACYYACAKNRFKTVLLPFDQVVRLALR